jgi:hypothetical protein
MLSKCANPKCTASFRYLHHGKLFRMEVPAALTHLNDPSEHTRKPPHRTEFFWLCEKCAMQMTLIYNKDLGVTTRLLPALGAGVGL